MSYSRAFLNLFDAEILSLNVSFTYFASSTSELSKMKKLFLLLFCMSLTFMLSAQTFTEMPGLLTATGNALPCIVDMNADGLDDVVTINGSNVQIDYQQADGTFEFVSYLAGINTPPNWSITAGDIDGNGYNDLMLGGGQRVSFVYANDDGTSYSEVNIDDYIFTQRTNLVDIDNDGHLDAFACHDVDQSHPFRNDGLGNLTEDQSLIITVPVGGNYASVWIDFDNDGDLDMHMSKCRNSAPPNDPRRMNGLYQNNGDGTFTEMAADVNMDDNDQSWVTIFEDFDNDGDLDTYTVNHAWGNRLMENDGTGYFTEVTAGSGIDASDLDSWACIGADFDNDGFIDILSESNANKEFYHNDGNMQFTAQSWSFDDGALGDLNNDGFIDVRTSNNKVYMNNGNANNYCKVALEGTSSNRNGIGARVEIFGDWGIQIRELRSGQSFRPASTLDLMFGLGTATSIDSLVIKWPSGGLDYYLDVPINSTFSAEEVPFTCPGDINTDGTINVADFIQLNSMFGQDCLNCPEDVNSDGKVDVTDFVVFNSTFGNSCE